MVIYGITRYIMHDTHVRSKDINIRLNYIFRVIFRFLDITFVI